MGFTFLNLQQQSTECYVILLETLYIKWNWIVSTLLRTWCVYNSKAIAKNEKQKKKKNEEIGKRDRTQNTLETNLIT